MTTAVIVLLTIILVVDCLFLGLLILVQLPKKEAGVGMAFGGGAADALFGAGSGSALTKLTKYSATAFFVLVFLLSVLKVHASRSTGSNLREQIEKTQQSVPVQPAASPTAPVKTGATTNSSPAGNLLIPIQTTNSSPAPAVPAAPVATNPAAGPGK